MLNVLVVDDAVIHSDRLAVFLGDKGFCVIATTCFSEAAEAVKMKCFDLILCEYWFEKFDGLAFLHSIKDLQETAVKVLMTGYPSCMSPTDLKWAGIDYLIHRSDGLESLDALKHALFSASRKESVPKTLKRKLQTRGGVDDTGPEVAVADRR